MKPLHFLLFLLPIAAAAQEVRTVVGGEITTPQGYDAEGIHIYNKTANLGTISLEEGQFQLRMAKGDTLYFSAIQFEAIEIVVDANTIAKGKMQVEIREGMNELPEIVLRSHDLTGNLEEDAKKIEVFTPVIPPLPPTLNTPTGATTTRNSVVNEIGGGANHLALLVKGIKALFPKRDKEVKQKPLTRFDRIAAEEKIRSNFDEDFFLENLGIPTTDIGDFLAFCIDENFDSRLLQENRRMELIQYLFDKAAEFSL